MSAVIWNTESKLDYLTSSEFMLSLMMMDRSQTGVLTVPFPLSTGNWLGYAEHYIKQKKWNPMDTMDTARRSWFCWRPGTSISYSETNARKDRWSIAAISAQLRLTIYARKTKILKANTTNTNPIKLNGLPLEEVKNFTYLGSVIDKQGGKDTDVASRIGKARAAFAQLKMYGTQVNWPYKGQAV